MSYIKEYLDELQQVKILVDYVTAEDRLLFKEKGEDNLIGLEPEEEKEEPYFYREL